MALALRSAFWTSGRLVGEALAGKEFLLAGREEKTLAAVATVEGLIGKQALTPFVDKSWNCRQRDTREKQEIHGNPDNSS